MLTIKSQTFNVHQFGAKGFLAMCDAENIIVQLLQEYPEGTVLMSPNTGEIVEIDELRRMAGILGFLTENRVVEVNPKI